MLLVLEKPLSVLPFNAFSGIIPRVNTSFRVFDSFTSQKATFNCTAFNHNLFNLAFHTLGEVMEVIKPEIPKLDIRKSGKKK